MNTKGRLIVVIIIIILGLGALYYFNLDQSDEYKEINTFEECAAAGYPIMDSYPEQCRTPDGRNFVREIPNPVPTTITTPTDLEPVACTMEAKICPDGSAVGRTGPNCEFAPCPVVKAPIAPVTITTGLNIPWEIVFLPGGEMLVTERAGRLIRIGTDKKVIEVSGVAHRGEGGLLGLALHPQFSENKLIYLYMTTLTGEKLTNRVERYKLDGITLSQREVMIENIPGANYHDGGRIKFGPDGMLYITTGDAGDTNNSQDKTSLAGKILRIRADGSIPTSNPFGNAIYSYGHRNSQGITWDNKGQLWATEHGPSGFESGHDEVNKVSLGLNYGWPKIRGNATETGMVTPQLNSGGSETWAPSGLTYMNGHLIFTGLRGQSLYVADVSSGTAKNLKTYFTNTYGRLRTVTVGPDNMLYVITNNRDSLGKPIASDDRIIKIDPKTLGI